jgi:N-methylhydantoinase A
MVDENMANAARVHTVENGRDIAQFTMVAFGGGAPLHACRLCEKLGLDEALIPPGAGVGSAIGFLQAPVSFEATRGLYQRLDAFDAATVNTMITELADAANAFVDRGAAGVPRITRLIAQMRYVGQGWEIPVELPHRAFSTDDVPMIATRFGEEYRTLFGRTIEGLAIEVTNWQLTVATQVQPVPPTTRFEDGAPAEPSRRRRFFDAALRETVEAAEVPRSAMTPGMKIDGPAIIVEDETATIVTSAFRAVGQGDGSLRLIRKGATR